MKQVDSQFPTIENKRCKVSVCIPTYNHAHFLIDAIESVLAQTFTDIELIVVDNCSTDNTKEVVDKIISVDRRVKYFCNEANIGPVKNLNRSLAYAHGEYVKILCADDMLEPTCLEKEVNVLDHHPRVVLVTSARLLVAKDLRTTGTLSYSDTFEIVDGFRAINRCLQHGNLIGEPSAVLFRRKLAGRGFEERYRQTIDLEMWFYLLEQGALASIPEALCKFRQHAEQWTKTNVRSLDFSDEFLLLKDYLGKSYVTLHYFEKMIAKFNRANHIWHWGSDLSFGDKMARIAKNFNPILFVFMLFLKKINRLCIGLFRKQI